MNRLFFVTDNTIKEITPSTDNTVIIIDSNNTVSKQSDISKCNGSYSWILLTIMIILLLIVLYITSCLDND